jgi:hypothetical protein
VWRENISGAVTKVAEDGSLVEDKKEQMAIREIVELRRGRVPLRSI